MRIKSAASNSSSVIDAVYAQIDLSKHDVALIFPAPARLLSLHPQAATERAFLAVVRILRRDRNRDVRHAVDPSLRRPAIHSLYARTHRARHTLTAFGLVPQQMPLPRRRLVAEELTRGFTLHCRVIPGGHHHDRNGQRSEIGLGQWPGDQIELGGGVERQ